VHPTKDKRIRHERERKSGIGGDNCIQQRKIGSLATTKYNRIIHPRGGEGIGLLQQREIEHNHNQAVVTEGKLALSMQRKRIELLSSGATREQEKN
jgi:hypothetical protein